MLAVVFVSSLVFAGEQLVMVGSTTVLPIAQACAEAFMDKNPSVDVTVRGGGSGVGIAALKDKTCNIANSSRPIQQKELAELRGSGVSPTEYAIAWDGLAVVVHPTVTVTNLTVAQVKDIYTGKIKNWKDVGGPNKSIVLVSRDVSSGTFEVFKEKVLKGASVDDAALKVASNNAVSQSVSQTPYSIGYLGIGYITKDVHALKIEGIEPTEQTTKNGTYPIIRKLYMYTNGEAKGKTKSFIDFVLSSEGQTIVSETGFVPIK